MSTASQISANQLNAQLSTGPVTAEGKAQTAKNAIRHGLTASYPVISTPDEQSVFNALESAYQYELHPYTPTEQSLCKQLVVAAWNIDRCHRLEAQLASTNGIDPLIDDSASKTLAKIETYRLRAERLFHRNLKELKAIPSTRPVPQNKPNPEPARKPEIIRFTRIVGRNEQCPCLSGKKYKFCCINKGQDHWPLGELI